jgi:hypothetical protein
MLSGRRMRNGARSCKSSTDLYAHAMLARSPQLSPTGVNGASAWVVMFLYIW